MATIRVSHGEFVMATGPYRGESVVEVHDEDPQYLDGLLNGELTPAEREVIDKVTCGERLPDTADFVNGDVE